MITKWIPHTFLAALALSAASSAPAQAGQYHVYSCRTPDGAVAPADGWSGTKAGSYTYVKNTCAEPGGALLAALGDQPIRTANTDVAKWELTVPATSTLVGATVWRAGDADGGALLNASYQFWIAAPSETKIVDQCVSGVGCATKGNAAVPLSPENRVVVPQERLGAHLYAIAACGGLAEFECPSLVGDTNNYAAALYVYAADLTLEQSAGPSASAVGGELATASSLAGTPNLSFTATDPGSGVYEAVFAVDGTVVQRTVLNENGGRCKDVGQTTDGLPAFLYLQPCLPSVSADVGFDTTHLLNGSHRLTVAVIDAAGNSAPVLDRNVTIANPGAPGPLNGQGASTGARLTARWKNTSKTLLSVAYGHSETVIGRLVDETGKPITGAQVAVADGSALSALQTGADGGFVMHLAAGASSRTLQFTYRARIGDSAPVAATTLQLAVRAPVSMGVSPRVAAVGRTIFFKGRLMAGPYPKGGKPVILEARAGKGAWIEFKVLRSDSHGRFRARYRFRFPGPVRYRFRALCEHEADYPFATGASSPVTVNER